MNQPKIKKNPYEILKSVFKRVLAKKIWEFLAYYKNIFLTKIFSPCYPLVEKRYNKIINRLRKKETIKAVFILFNESIWKYDGVYRLMAQDERFEVVVVVCPNTGFGEEYLSREMHQAYANFSAQGYNVIKAFNEDTLQWLDIKKKINPDVVFFTNPGNITLTKYYVNNFLDCLTIYVPYGIMAANIQRIQYDLLFHNLIWRCYYETVIHKEMANKYATNKGRNVVITGFPGCDFFLDSTYLPKDIWKIKDRKVKRIIWAPHHTLQIDKKQYAYANFLKNFQFMLNLLKQFEGKIQIAFKPHPLLKPALYHYPDWGKERTDAYYKTWQTISNGQLEEGGYIDLFLTSDAMILDSISFISEFLYTGKPSLFLLRDNTIINKFNEYGQIAFNQMYKAYNDSDIISFINITVLKGQDPLLESRRAFVNKYLVPPNNQTAAKNIYYDLVKEVRL